ncbi:hypothetical protein [Roseivirga echinicomitans]|uniref:DUF7847 domain-containing protein n=1 Tax=Roseivirga echinicomitans TaxID=296218 RepID=A0A150X9Z8_9BACT|nr:hypothetical protein [Roseivirga echinicomitans]KYG75555.1 hypothetical protein AWN68_07300 [Roseivirga echinicomitans]
MGYTPQIEFYKKRQFGDKLNMTFVFLRENAWPYLRAQLLISGPILLISNILMSQLSLGVFNFGEGGFTPDMIINMFSLYGLVMISAVVTSAVLPAVAYGYMKAYQHKAPSEIRIPDVTKNLLSKIFNLLVFNVLTAIVVVIGMFFFVIPGVYLGVVLSLGSAIIVFEDNNPIDAFGRAFKLIKDKWWSTLGLLFVTGIIGYVINMLFSLPRTLLVFGDVFTSVQESGDLSSLDESNFGSNPLSILFSVLETFGAVLTYSISFLALAFQYFNLVERRESRGLMSRIEQMDDAGNVEDEETY